MGAGVRQDLGQAAYWYRRAAAQGAPAGQYNMAVMLEDGVGVDRDYPDSYFWYDQALQRDFFDIRGSSRERVSAKMTMAEILSTQPDESDAIGALAGELADETRESRGPWRIGDDVIECDLG